MAFFLLKKQQDGQAYQMRKINGLLGNSFSHYLFNDLKEKELLNSCLHLNDSFVC